MQNLQCDGAATVPEFMYHGQQVCIEIYQNLVHVSSKTRRDMVRSTVNSTDNDTLPVSCMVWEDCIKYK